MTEKMITVYVVTPYTNVTTEPGSEGTPIEIFESDWCEFQQHLDDAYGWEDFFRIQAAIIKARAVSAQ